jgi:hypothetical protein
MSMRRELVFAVSVMALACSSVQAQQGEKQEPAPVAEQSNSKAEDDKPVTQPPADDVTKAADASTSAVSPDPAVLTKIGAASLDIIAGADRAELVEVATSKNPDAKSHLQEHEIKSAPVALSAEMLTQFRTSIFTKATHILGARARCRYRPTHGLIFYQGEQKTSVLIAAPKCSKWSFEGTPKRRIIDIRKAAGKTLAEHIEKIKGGDAK